MLLYISVPIYSIRRNEDLEKNLRDGALVKISIDRHGNAKVKEFVENK